MGEGQGLVWMLHLHGDLTSELDRWPETKLGWDWYHIIWVLRIQGLSVVPDHQQHQLV